MIGNLAIHGHAIVSDDDCIADARGNTPVALRNDADWRRFQLALDGAAVTVLGRLGHHANPNRKQRNRLVVSFKATGIEQRDNAWWWNPAEAPLAEALAAAAPNGGIAAVAGGRPVFDMFLALGFDEFHLARKHGLRLGDGVPVFTAAPTTPGGAAAVLAAHSLRADPEEWLDRDAAVSLTVWRRVV